MKDKDEELKFAIIPEDVLHYDHKKMPANAKLLLSEIIFLCNDKGYCWASNKYFADRFGVSVTSVSLWIASLQNNGFIRCKIWKNSENHTRQIHLMKSLREIKAPFFFLVAKLLHSMSDESLSKLEGIYKEQQPSDAAVLKDDFNIETEEWVDEKGHKRGRDSIDYEG